MNLAHLGEHAVSLIVLAGVAVVIVALLADLGSTDSD